MRRIVLVAVACLVFGHAFGFAQATNYTIYGQGNLSCGEWIASNLRGTHLYATWVLGFVSGTGFASRGDLRQTDSSGIAAWIDNYCQANPLETIEGASASLVSELEVSQ